MHPFGCHMHQCLYLSVLFLEVALRPVCTWASLSKSPLSAIISTLVHEKSSACISIIYGWGEMRLLQHLAVFCGKHCIDLKGAYGWLHSLAVISLGLHSSCVVHSPAFLHVSRVEGSQSYCWRIYISSDWAWPLLSVILRTSPTRAICTRLRDLK